MRAPARPFLLPFALVALLLLLAPSRALAWVEWHHLGDNVRLTLGADGKAVVETTSRYDVVRGPIKSFDVLGIDADARLDADLRVERLAAAPLGAGAGAGDGQLPEGASGDYRGHVEPLPRRPDAAFEGQAVRLVMDGESAQSAKAKAGLPRGAYAVTWRYSIDAASASRWFSREGARLRLVFQGTHAPEGYDSARLLVVVPTAPEPPRLAPMPWGATVAALRRGPGEDELELVRPHVARAEAPRFAVDLDTRLLPLAARPELRPVAPRPVASRTFEHVAWVLLGAAFGIVTYALLRARPNRALLAATLACTSVGIEALVGFEWALLVAPALLWLALPAGQAEKQSWWQPALAVVVLGGLASASYLLGGPCPAASSAVRALALLPALVAVCPDRTRTLLERLAARATAKEECTLQVRLDTDPSRGTRLVVLPAVPLEGFGGLELGRSRAGIASLARVRSGSVAEARLRSLWPQAHARPGRVEGEVAYVLFAPTTRPRTLGRMIALVGPAFGERRLVQSAVLAERRREPAAGRISVAWA